eukprot:COSAG02_NODE_1489_length_12365_cov_22.798793_4_plen_152_part_00
MSIELSERIGQLVIPAAAQCTTPETSASDLRLLTVYGAWTPNDELEYAGTTVQPLEARAKQHRYDVNANSFSFSPSVSRHGASLQVSTEVTLGTWPSAQCQLVGALVRFLKDCDMVDVQYELKYWDPVDCGELGQTSQSEPTKYFVFLVYM